MIAFPNPLKKFQDISFRLKQKLNHCDSNVDNTLHLKIKTLKTSRYCCAIHKYNVMQTIAEFTRIHQSL